MLQSTRRGACGSKALSTAWAIPGGRNHLLENSQCGPWVRDINGWGGGIYRWGISMSGGYSRVGDIHGKGYPWVVDIYGWGISMCWGYPWVGDIHGWWTFMGGGYPWVGDIQGWRISSCGDIHGWGISRGEDIQWWGYPCLGDIYGWGISTVVHGWGISMVGGSPLVRGLQHFYMHNGTIQASLVTL